MKIPDNLLDAYADLYRFLAHPNDVVMYGGQVVTFETFLMEALTNDDIVPDCSQWRVRGIRNNRLYPSLFDLEMRRLWEISKEEGF